MTAVTAGAHDLYPLKEVISNLEGVFDSDSSVLFRLRKEAVISFWSRRGHQRTEIHGVLSRLVWGGGRMRYVDRENGSVWRARIKEDHSEYLTNATL